MRSAASTRPASVCARTGHQCETLRQNRRHGIASMRPTLRAHPARMQLSLLTMSPTQRRERSHGVQPVETETRTKGGVFGPISSVPFQSRALYASSRSASLSSAGAPVCGERSRRVSNKSLATAVMSVGHQLLPSHTTVCPNRAQQPCTTARLKMQEQAFLTRVPSDTPRQETGW